MEISSSNESVVNSDDDFINNHCQVLRFTDMKGKTKEMYFPKSLDLERPKRSRTNFTTKQLYELEKSFAKNQYLVGKERKLLSKQLNLSEAQIKIWYQNRRTKHKKEQLRHRQQLSANAETIAANNIMQLLAQQTPSSPPHPMPPQQHSHNNTTTITVTNAKQLHQPSPVPSLLTNRISLNFDITTLNNRLQCNDTTKLISNTFISNNNCWNETNYLMKPIDMPNNTYNTNHTNISIPLLPK